MSQFRNFTKRQQTWARAIKKMRYCGELREFSQFVLTIMRRHDSMNCPKTAPQLAEMLADAAEQVIDSANDLHNESGNRKAA